MSAPSRHILAQGVEVPPFLYGTAWKEDRTRELTGLALASGFRGIDTANQRRHYVEAAVGEAVEQFLGRSGLRREELFLQTKFTYLRGQDHRLPYDPDAEPETQVRQSIASSLEHLGTSYVNSYVLHGPASGHAWTPEDARVWETMAALQTEGKTRLLGVSNVALLHLERLCSSSTVRPAFVQNRCYARLGWDWEVRQFCTANGIVYQGFSLLTANPEVLAHPSVARIAARLEASRPQVVFRFAQQLGMLPLTGTSREEAMRADLACGAFELTEDELEELETLAG
jgi:diketogulonate reductase-like aldo/keto reductase